MINMNIIINIIIALINHTKFLKFMLLNQSRHVSDEPSSIISRHKHFSTCSLLKTCWLVSCTVQNMLISKFLRTRRITAWTQAVVLLRSTYCNWAKCFVFEVIRNLIKSTGHGLHKPWLTRCKQDHLFKHGLYKTHLEKIHGLVVGCNRGISTYYNWAKCFVCIWSHTKFSWINGAQFTQAAAYKMQTGPFIQAWPI